MGNPNVQLAGWSDAVGGTDGDWLTSSVALRTLGRAGGIARSYGDAPPSRAASPTHAGRALRDFHGRPGPDLCTSAEHMERWGGDSEEI
jgi:hypothetical protein